MKSLLYIEGRITSIIILLTSKSNVFAQHNCFKIDYLTFIFQSLRFSLGSVELNGVFASVLRESPIIRTDLQIRTTYGVTNPNSVRIQVGGFVSGNQVYEFLLKKKICTPRNTVFIHDFFRSFLFIFFNQLFSHALFMQSF